MQATIGKLEGLIAGGWDTLSSVDEIIDGFADAESLGATDTLGGMVSSLRIRSSSTNGRPCKCETLIESARQSKWGRKHTKIQMLFMPENMFSLSIPRQSTK